MNKKVLVASLQDSGELSEKNFTLKESPIPTASDLKENEGLRTYDSYLPHAEQNNPMGAQAVGRIHLSKSSKYKVGDLVWTHGEWALYQIVNENAIAGRIDDLDESQAKYYLHTLGMPGLTAYTGLYGIGEPKAGETVVISNASATVSLTVAQLAQVEKCHTVGITSTEAKAAKLKESGAFNEVIAMETVTIQGLEKALKEACPQGIDIYFDNVGGEISDTVATVCNAHARIAVCGAISQYNHPEETKVGLRIWLLALEKRLKIQGFILGNSMWDQIRAKGVVELKRLFKEGKITPANEVVIEGIENAPRALIDLYKNKFHGKLIIKNVF